MQLRNNGSAPVGSFLIKTFLSVVTFGIAAAKDSIYRQAAFGFTERSGDLLLIVLAILVLLSPAIMYLANQFFRAALALQLMEHELELKLMELQPMERQRMEKQLTKQQTRNVKTWPWQRIGNVLFICFVLVSSILFVQLLTNVYSNTIVANFHRTLAVATPHISSEQRSVYLARFAKVQTRKDFITLFAELNSVLKNNGESPSDFSPW
jgi:hypothetical protein